jgi:F-type H+-transporting ATPase subunit delta
VAAELSVVSEVAGRYAAALFELARDEGKLDEVARDLESLGRMLDESPELTRLVRSPLFDREQQEKALAQVLERAGAGPLVRNFAGVVARNRRLFALRDMATGFARLLAEHRGEVVARVTSAHPLSEAQLSRLKAELSAEMKTDVRLDAAVDESLLGGLVVRLGSRMIDSSIRSKLQRLEFAMKGAE